MKTGGKYRFNLGFSANSVEEIRAGELLESLGQKKSVMVVAALNEYMDRHPELISGGGKIEIKTTSITTDSLESLVRRILEEKVTCPNIPAAVEKQVNDVMQGDLDIQDMLNDLDIFN